MNKKDWLIIFVIISLFLGKLYVLHRNIFFYRFDSNLIKKYFLSQDITYEVYGKRLFLSDGDIHIAAGYLYLLGIDPTQYNFQHPPLIKYLYGISIYLIDNPYIVQIVFGIVFLILTYYLGILTFKSTGTSLLTSLFLIMDPLFLDISSQPLLDLGQSVFLLLYLIAMLYYKNNFLLQGLSLGLLSTSKFWGAAIFFFLILTFYIWYRRQFDFKPYLIHLVVALITFSLTYTKTFLNEHGQFNIFLFELKTLKFWLNHSVASTFGSSLFLFLTGFSKSWWGNKLVIRSDIWSLLWPISLVVSFIGSYKKVLSRKINTATLIFLIPIIYFIYISLQAPFIRYFILILPFLYLALSNFIFSYLRLFLKPPSGSAVVNQKRS